MTTTTSRDGLSRAELLQLLTRVLENPTDDRLIVLAQEGRARGQPGAFVGDAQRQTRDADLTDHGVVHLGDELVVAQLRVGPEVGCILDDAGSHT